MTFVVAGLGVLGVPILRDAWRVLAVISASPSLLLLVVFWHPWLIVGVLLDVRILLALIVSHWPSESVIGL